ncbi:MAG: hypothetical protein ACYCVD_13420 [Desulfitobacteriaceae bacterium]
MEEKFRVLVIGPEDNVNDVMECHFLFHSLDLIRYPYKTPEGAIEIIRKNLGNFDGVLFTGPIPYMIASEVFQDEFPMVYLPFGGKALTKALFQALYQGANLARISIDTITRHEAYETLHELGLNSAKLFCLQYARVISTKEFVDYHFNLYKKGEIDIAFTCLKSAHEQLLELGVPTIRIMTPRSVIIDALEKVQLIGESVVNQSNQLVVIFIGADIINEMSYTTVEVHEKLLELERMILKFTHEVEGNLTRSVRDQFVIITTRTLFEQSTESMTLMPLLGNILNHASFTLQVGVGIANTASIAGYHARIALQKSKKNGENTCFVCLPNKSIFGPLGTYKSTSHKLTVVEPLLLELAEKTGLSPPLLERVIKSIKDLGTQYFTSYDVAMKLGMSLRNARKILQHLLGQKVVVLAGKELISTRGKPRNVYTLNSKFFI